MRRDEADSDDDSKQGLLDAVCDEGEPHSGEVVSKTDRVELSASTHLLASESASASAPAARAEEEVDAVSATDAGVVDGDGCPTQHMPDPALDSTASTVNAEAAHDDAVGAREKRRSGKEEEEEEEERELPKGHWTSCFVDDVRIATKEAFNPITLLLCLITGFSIFYAIIGHPWEYHHKPRKPNLEGNVHDAEAFAAKVRYVPPEFEQMSMKRALIYSRSVVEALDDDGAGRNVTFGMFAKSDFEDREQARLPEVWYRCMHVGVSPLDFFDPDLSSLSLPDYDDDEFYSTLHQSPDDREWHEERAEDWRARRQEVDEQTTEMLGQLWDLETARPSAVLNWDISSNVTSWPWRVQGWVVRFCPEDLSAQGMLGSGKTFKSRFERAAEGVAVVARRFGVNIVLHWYPHKWGNGALDDERLHTNVLQEIVPTRSGLQALRSHGVVWRLGGPEPKPPVVQLTREELAEIQAMAGAGTGAGEL